MSRELLRRSASGPNIYDLIGVYTRDGVLYEKNNLQILGLATYSGDDPPQSGGTVTLDAGVVNIREYQAVGDGVADDTDSIQAAIDAEAGPVFIPEGEFIVTQLVLKPGTIMFGVGPTSILKRKDGFLTDAQAEEQWAVIYGGTLTASHKLLGGITSVTLRNFTVDGNVDNQPLANNPDYWKHGTVEVDAANIYIVGDFSEPYDLAVRGSVVIDGLTVINSSENGIVVNNTASSTIRNCIISKTWKNGVYFAQNPGCDQRAVNNDISDCGRIYGGGIAFCNSYGEAVGNRVSDCAEYGILVSSTGTGTRPASDISIVGNSVRCIHNRIYNDSRVFVASDIGIGIRAQSPAGDDRAWSVRGNIAICGNTVTGTVGGGISVDGVSIARAYQLHGATISGNTVLLADGIGIAVRDSNGVAVVGNSVVAPDSYAYAVYDSRGVIVQGNYAELEYGATDIVWYSGKAYQCLVRNLSYGLGGSLSSLTPADDPTNWSDLGAIANVYPSWMHNQVYSPSGRGNATDCYYGSGNDYSVVWGVNAYRVTRSIRIESGDASIQVERSQDAAPTEGFWKAGSRIWNSAPAGGAPMGWICTTGGALAANWVISTAYDVGNLVRNSSTGYVYIVTTAGTSDGTQPTGTGTFTDAGGVVYSWCEATNAVFGAMPNL